MSNRTRDILALIAMVAVLGGLVWWALSAFQAMRYNWAWDILFCTEATCDQPYMYWFLSGLRWTILVSLAAWVIAFSLGSIVGIARTVKHPVINGLATGYVGVFRNIPLLVQMFLWFFVVPEIFPEDIGRWIKRDLPFPEFWTGVMALGTYHASRTAEQVRAGIDSIPKGQTYAAMAVGLNPLQVYRHVLLPVSFRIIIPPLTSDFLGIVKNSSVALTIGVMEITAQSRQIGEYTFNYFETFTAATVLYLIITALVTVLMRVIEGRARIPGMISMGAD